MNATGRLIVSRIAARLRVVTTRVLVMVRYIIEEN